MNTERKAQSSLTSSWQDAFNDIKKFMTTQGEVESMTSIAENEGNLKQTRAELFRKNQPYVEEEAVQEVLMRVEILRQKILAEVPIDESYDAPGPGSKYGGFVHSHHFEDNDSTNYAISVEEDSSDLDVYFNQQVPNNQKIWISVSREDLLDDIYCDIGFSELNPKISFKLDFETPAVPTDYDAKYVDFELAQRTSYKSRVHANDMIEAEYRLLKGLVSAFEE